MNAPAIRLVGLPDGPQRYVPELGCSVGTFIKKSHGKIPTLDYHIPLNMRGDFRPTDLANYDPGKKYRTDEFGKVLCYADTKAGLACSKRAVNRNPLCEIHGGRLHPLDKIVKDNEEAKTKREGESLSRYRQFVAGQIGVEDLDDEELATCGFRASNGRIYKPKSIPREMAHAFTRAIYERAQQELRSNTVKAAQVMAEIMVDESNDANIRLKAAEMIIERNLGKTPQVVAITGQAAYEEIFEEITGGSREQSRQRRAITSERIIDAQFDDIETDVSRDATVEDVVQSVDGDESPNLEPTQLNSEPNEPGARDARLFERNTAILAKVIERPEFKFDLSVVKDDQPLVRKKFKTKDGKIRIRHVDPGPPPASGETDPWA